LSRYHTTFVECVRIRQVGWTSRLKVSKIDLHSFQQHNSHVTKAVNIDHDQSVGYETSSSDNVYSVVCDRTYTPTSERNATLENPMTNRSNRSIVHPYYCSPAGRTYSPSSDRVADYNVQRTLSSNRFLLPPDPKKRDSSH
jgi:hypothetical protein